MADVAYMVATNQRVSDPDSFPHYGELISREGPKPPQKERSAEEIISDTLDKLRKYARGE